jgi:hypothetical protein
MLKFHIKIDIYFERSFYLNMKWQGNTELRTTLNFLFELVVRELDRVRKKLEVHEIMK